MGCGKSTALAMFRNFGTHTFDADACVRNLLTGDETVKKEILSAFGEGVFTSDGMVDRKALGHIVFNHTSKLEVLESLLHPRVRTAWQQELVKGHPCFVVEIPLLFENSLESCFDATVCVAVRPEVQRKRLLARGLEESDIDKRLSRQWPLERKMQAADHVLCNDGAEAHLRDQIEYLLKLWGCPVSDTPTHR